MERLCQHHIASRSTSPSRSVLCPAAHQAQSGRALAGSVADACGATDATSSKKTAACGGEAALSGFVWPTADKGKGSAQHKVPAQNAVPATRGARGGVKAAKAARAKDVEAAGAETGVTTGIDAMKALQASLGATTASAVVGSAGALVHQSRGALQAPAARQTSARSAQEGGVAVDADMQQMHLHPHTPSLSRGCAPLKLET